VRSVRQVQGALLLDGSGELVVAAGQAQERDRIIGAYQAVLVYQARRAADRHALGEVQALVFRHRGGSVVLRPLKDGYYLVLTFGPDANVARGLHHSATVQERLDREL
jgi:predicted regulator of Ras-like GTPase activity (Roadblock/LC7/MglB family)